VTLERAKQQPQKNKILNPTSIIPAPDNQITSIVLEIERKVFVDKIGAKAMQLTTVKRATESVGSGCRHGKPESTGGHCFFCAKSIYVVTDDSALTPQMRFGTVNLMFDVLSLSLMDALPALARATLALFIIVDPFGSIPVFITLTEKMDAPQRRRVFRSATLTGFVLMVIFALTGQQILAFFGVSLYSFMIAGGLLLLIIAIKLLIEGEWWNPEGSLESLSAVPLAVPLLVGPGAITATILNLQEFGIAVTLVAVVAVFLIVWLVLRLVEPIHKFLGKSGSSIIARIMALFIAAIAVQYMITGIIYYLPSA
jgi:multiple antibiotic resistance protein